jgi:hypothetical protein
MKFEIEDEKKEALLLPKETEAEKKSWKIGFFSGEI